MNWEIKQPVKMTAFYEFPWSSSAIKSCSRNEKRGLGSGSTLYTPSYWSVLSLIAYSFSALIKIDCTTHELSGMAKLLVLANKTSTHL